MLFRSPLDTNEPDYSKTQKVDESTKALEIQLEIDNINIEIKKLDPKAADYETKKRDLDAKLLDASKRMDAQKTADQTAKV